MIWLEPRWVDKLTAMRCEGESIGNVREAGGGRTRVTERVPDAQARPMVYSSLGDRVMVNTAWIDRPVDTRGLHSLLPRLP
jgi:hypothetical protein